MTAAESSSGEVFGLTRQQEYRAARLVASASNDAADCALLLAALGIHPADWPPLDDHEDAPR